MSLHLLNRYNVTNDTEKLRQRHGYDLPAWEQVPGQDELVSMEYWGVSRI